MSQQSFSPLQIIEDTAYQKLKDTPFSLWHYLVSLAFLTIIPSVVSIFFESAIVNYFLAGVVALAWVMSRVAGRVLSRRENYDSVLTYRYFALTPWVIGAATTGIALLTQSLTGFDHILYVGIFYLTLAVSLLQLLGIYIHIRKSKKMTHNIKKEDLFQ